MTQERRRLVAQRAKVAAVFMSSHLAQETLRANWWDEVDRGHFAPRARRLRMKPPAFPARFVVS